MIKLIALITLIAAWAAFTAVFAVFFFEEEEYDGDDVRIIGVNYEEDE